MIEIIERAEGLVSHTETINQGRPQISYNSDGRLVVRVIHGELQDTLIVFDDATSAIIKRFVSEIYQPNHRLPF